MFFSFLRESEIRHQTVVFIETTTQIPKSGDKHWQNAQWNQAKMLK
jgi:hypothetical protein